MLAMLHDISGELLARAQGQVNPSDQSPTVKRGSQDNSLDGQRKRPQGVLEQTRPRVRLPSGSPRESSPRVRLIINNNLARTAHRISSW